MLNTLKELWRFLRIRKKYWLFPIVFFMIFIGFMLVATQGTALSPFVYALF